MTGITDSFQRLDHPRVASIGDAACSICLESHHRHLVGDYVMKLTGDPGSLVGYCSTGFLLPIALGSFNPLPQFLDATTLLVNLTTHQERSDGDDHRRNQADTGHRLERGHA